MSDPTNKDLSGSWSGRYDYEAGSQPVPFEATLACDGTILSGEIQEPNTIRHDGGDTLAAEISGQWSAQEVTFVKYYQSFEQGDHPAYHGEVNPDLTRIVGVWWFPNQPHWRGRFMMVRAVRATARRSAKVAVEDPVE